MRIRHPKDFLTGVMFVGFGAAAMASSFGLAIGSAAKMGPGYFPLVLGGFLVVLGAVILLRGVWGAGETQGWPALQFKPLAIVLLSVILFSQILRPLGLLLSTAGLVVLASMASHEFRWKETLLNAAVLVAIVLAVFVFFLEFQLPIWPSFLAGRA
jgi:hypothetical protein